MISGNHRSSAVLYQDHWIENENEIGKPLRKIHSTENEIHLYSTFEVDIQLLEATISNFWTGVNKLLILIFQLMELLHYLIEI